MGDREFVPGYCPALLQSSIFLLTKEVPGPATCMRYLRRGSALPGFDRGSAATSSGSAQDGAPAGILPRMTKKGSEVGRGSGSADAGAGDVLQPQSLVELATARLRSEILSGALEPGERLVEEQLTQRFQISRAPLREAMRQLAEQGLVEHLPRRGVRVTTYSERDFDELFAVRDAMERFAVSLLSGRKPDELDMAPLEKCLKHLRTAAEHGDRLAASKPTAPST